MSVKRSKLHKHHKHHHKHHSRISWAAGRLGGHVRVMCRRRSAAGGDALHEDAMTTTTSLRTDARSPAPCRATTFAGSWGGLCRDSRPASPQTVRGIADQERPTPLPWVRTIFRRRQSKENRTKSHRPPARCRLGRRMQRSQMSLYGVGTSPTSQRRFRNP